MRQTATQLTQTALSCKINGFARETQAHQEEQTAQFALNTAAARIAHVSLLKQFKQREHWQRGSYDISKSTHVNIITNKNALAGYVTSRLTIRTF